MSLLLEQEPRPLRSTSAASRPPPSERPRPTARGDTVVRALDEVTVDFEAGRFTAIMGPSGSGKSTLMHCVAGLDDLTSGTVLIGDADLTTMNDRQLTQLRRDHVGFIFQAFNLVPTLTALENITLPMRPRRTQARPGVARPGHRHRRPREPALSTARASSPVASSSGSPWPGPWPAGPRSSSATSPPATSTAARGAEILVVHAHGRAGARPDHRHGHPRPGGGQLRRPRRLPRRRPDRRRPAPAHRRLGHRPDEELGEDLMMFRLTVKSLWAHKLRFALTGLAVVLGVAFMAGTHGPHRHHGQDVRRSLRPGQPGHRRRRAAAADAVDAGSADVRARDAGRHRRHRPGRRRRARPPRARSRASPSWSRPTAPSARPTVSARPSASTGCRRPRLNPFHLASGHAPAGRRRGGARPGHRRARGLGPR